MKILSNYSVKLILVSLYFGFNFSRGQRDCGIPIIEPIVDSTSSLKIFGGIEARPHSWPWQVYIKTCYAKGQCTFCGGSLISANKILTAAHCTGFGNLPTESIKIWLGLHNVATDFATVKQFSVKGYEVKSRNSKSYDDDLAVMTLNEFVIFNDTVSPVCLSSEFTDPAPGDLCYAVGWGYTESGFSNVLKQVALPVLDDKICASRLPEGGTTISGKLCAGAERGKDTCRGDSGGPLVCYHTDRWYLVGVTSYGNDVCGTDGSPGIYTRISYYTNWILNL